MSKPHANDPGYRCSLRTPSGQAVVYDRKGLILPQRIDRQHPRWDVVSYDRRDAIVGIDHARTEREARQVMKDLRSGERGPAPAAPPARPQPKPKPSAATPRQTLPRRAAQAALDAGVRPGYARGWMAAATSAQFQRETNHAEAVASLKRSPEAKAKQRRRVNA